MNNMIKQFCPNCEKSTLVDILTKKETIKVRDMTIPAISVVSKCSECQGIFATESQEEANLQKAYAEYRAAKKLLSHSDMKQIRQLYGLSQTNFSRWLGWGDVTMHRYESGSLQDTVHNETLLLLKDPRNAKVLLENYKENLDPITAERLEKTISNLISQDQNQMITFDLETALTADPPSQFNGYRRFNMERFENLVLYIIEKAGPSFKTALNKFLWYIDFGFYAEQTQSITGSKYLKFAHGPIPKSYDYLFANMTEKGLLKVEEIQFKNYSGERYHTLTRANTDLFQGNELKAMDQWIKKLKQKARNAKQLSDLAHMEKAYQLTKDEEPISYQYACELKIKISRSASAH